MSRTLLNTKDVACFLGLKPCTLEKWRHVGEGPPFVKVGTRAVRYRLQDVEDFLSSRTNTTVPIRPRQKQQSANDQPEEVLADGNLEIDV